MKQYPYYPSPPYQGYPTPYNLAQETLTVIDPVVKHGLAEAAAISYPHALKEAAAISYLLGKGYDLHTAHQTVESWWQLGYY